MAHLSRQRCICECTAELADAVIPGEDLNFEPFSSVAYFAYEARLLHMGMDKNVLRDLYSDLRGRTLDA